MAVNSQILAAYAAERYRKLQLNECFDAIDLSSRPTEAQHQVLSDFGTLYQQYVTAGNQSGKSQIGARMVSWVFQESHPHWKRPPEWGNESLLIIVMGRTTKQIEETLWKKISTFIDENEVHIQRVGGVIQKVVHKKNKNTIIFLSHHNDNEAREKVQSFVAHLVWLDEMPGSEKLIEELHRRVQARRGYFLSTFTPKVRNESIRKMVDSVQMPYGKKYQFNMLDNPIYTEADKQKIMSDLSSFTEEYRNTILCGNWIQAETAVYEFNSDTMVRAPDGYSPAWRHVEASDPALQSKFGFTLWAEQPSTGHWYLIKALYLEGLYVPQKVVEEIISITKGYNMVRRVADPHEAWYLHTASQAGLTYVTPWNKNSRKGELIKGLQTMLGKEAFVAPWCHDFVEEIQSCQWSEKADNKIVNSSSYHLLDSAQYFADCRPKYVASPETKPWAQELRESNDKRKREEYLAKSKTSRPTRVTRGRNVWGGR